MFSDIGLQTCQCSKSALNLRPIQFGGKFLICRKEENIFFF